jgi:hypothetical protein
LSEELGCRGYVRYVDDGLVFADDKAYPVEVGVRPLWRGWGN